MAGETVNIEDAKAEEPKVKEKRVISTIEFPYNDLETAITVARGVQRRAGTMACSLAELAVELNHALDSGTFRLKVTAARMFGLVTVERNEVTLTELGRQILDGAPEERRAELAEAFLSVELYKALYRKYEGYALPPAAALEREIAALGVSEKQKDKARQAFDRSARFAGFIAMNGRLIRPAMVARAPGPPTEPAAAPDKEAPAIETREPAVGGGGRGGNEGMLDLDPLILGLLRRLPRPSSERHWPARERARWLQALAVNLGIIYAPDDAEEIDISVRSPTF